MASYNELNALIDAYINRNGVQAITGQILNGVLKAMVEQLGRGYTIIGAATPTTDPGTPDGPECYFASTPGTYTDFDGLQVVPGELALLCYTPSDGWTKETIYEGFQEVQATIDGNVGTPSVGVSYADGILSFDFRNMKGNPGQNGQDGAAAGFGTIDADITGGVGTPGVTVESSGPATAKNLQFHFTNLKGETGVTSVVATVDNTTGNPTCAVSLVGQQLTLAFTGLKGAQGNTGSSVDYPFTIVNNLTTDDATQALSAAQGVVLDGKISQLQQKVTDLEDELTDSIPVSVTTTLVQGYASAGSGKVTIGELATRVRSYVIMGNYTISVKPGYYIRAVIGYARGEVMEGNPSATFNAVSVATLSSGSTNTSFTKTDSTRPYSIITFCKTNANENIAPTEDIIESFISDKTDPSILTRVENLDESINGESIPYTLAQGYVIKNGSDVDVYRTETTAQKRVMTAVLSGNYRITLKSGYVVRGVTAWNGGLSSGIPSASFTPTDCTNLLVSGSSSSFVKDDSWQYSIVVISKSNADSAILPTEDCVERLSIYPGGLIDRVATLEQESFTTLHTALVMGDSINYGLASYFNGDLSGVVVDTSNRISDYLSKLSGIVFDNIAERGTGYVADTRNLGNGWEKAQDTDFGNYELVFIALGINDYIQHATIGDLSTKVEGTVIGNMTRILDKIATDNPFCKVVVFSPYNSWGQVCDDPGSEYQADSLYGDESTDYALGFAISGNTLQDYINAIEDVCEYYHIQLVKLSESGAINRSNIKKVLADGLHPVVEARPMLAAELFGRKMFDK